MKYKAGLVSVIIPTYKRADKLLRAINSVVAQTYRKMEILVVNDNEAEDVYTKAIYELFQEITDKRVRLIMQPRHINGAAARNVGIRMASGEYIAFLDDDDLWDSRKIERQVKAITRLDNSYGAVSTLYASFLGDRVIRHSLPYRDGYIWEDILLRNIEVTTCSVLLRHVALDETGYFDERLSRHQEVQLLAYLTHSYKIYLLKEELLYVDAWGENNPSANKIISTKKEFFKSVRPLIRELPARRRKRIVTMHKFEIAYVFCKEHRYDKAIQYVYGVFKSPYTTYYAAKRVIDRVRGTDKRGKRLNLV